MHGVGVNQHKMLDPPLFLSESILAFFVLVRTLPPLQGGVSGIYMYESGCCKLLGADVFSNIHTHLLGVPGIWLVQW